MWILGIALALSALYWFATTWLSLQVRQQTPVLARLNPPELASWPTLCLVIPACNEAQTLGPALTSRLAQDYPGLEVILIDDRSTDATFEVASAIAAHDSRLRVERIRELPDGWLGKVHALARGTELCHGEWLLFSDADVHFVPGTLRRAIAHCEARGLDHLGVVPHILPSGFWVDVVLATFCRMVAPALRLRPIEDPHSRAAIGVGAFNLVRRSALQRSPGLGHLRMEVVDDMALGQMLKRSGARSSLALGQGSVELDFYPSLHALMVGMEKNGFATLGRFNYARAVLSALTFFSLECMPCCALACGGHPAVQLSGLLLLILALTQAMRANRLLGRAPGHALFYPIGTALLLGFGLRATWLAAYRGGVAWRGTLYPLRALREGARLQFP